MRKPLVLLVAAGLTTLSAGFPSASVFAATPGASAAAPARARAWVTKLAVTQAEQQQILQVAEVGAEGGASPAAAGMPLAVGGQAPARASADKANPDSVATQWTWNDSTGSGSAEGGFAEAHVAGDSAQVRAGMGSMAGSGFAISSKAFTWEQQEMLMNNWISTMETIFVPLNAEMKALEPILLPLGIIPPHFEQMAALGWVDVLKMRQVAANAETASSAEFSSAHATASLGELSMFSGFIQARGISSDAFSQSTGGTDERRALATIKNLKIAGVPVFADSNGIHVARNDQISRAILQPGLDVLLGTLQSGGMTIRVAEQRGEGDLRETSALQVDIVSPQGSMTFSIGHAEASAKSVGAADFGPPEDTGTTNAGDTSSSTDTSFQPTDTSFPPTETPPIVDLGAPVSSGGNSGGTGTQVRRYMQPAGVLSIDTVRSLRTSYLLLFILGGTLGAVLMPLLARAPSTPRSRKGRR